MTAMTDIEWEECLLEPRASSELERRFTRELGRPSGTMRFLEGYNWLGDAVQPLGVGEHEVDARPLESIKDPRPGRTRLDDHLEEPIRMAITEYVAWASMPATNMAGILGLGCRRTLRIPA